MTSAALFMAIVSCKNGRSAFEISSYQRSSAVNPPMGAGITYEILEEMTSL